MSTTSTFNEWTSRSAIAKSELGEASIHAEIQRGNMIKEGASEPTLSLKRHPQHSEMMPRGALPPSIHGTRAEWESLKQLGDAAWAEWDLRFGTATSSAESPAAPTIAPEDTPGTFEYADRKYREALAKTQQEAKNAFTRAAVEIGDGMMEAFLKEQLAEYREHERERLERAANPPAPKEAPPQPEKFVVWYDPAGSDGTSDASLAQMAVAGRNFPCACEAATGPVIYTTEEAALASIAAVWSKMERYGATKKMTYEPGAADPAPITTAPAPLDHFVVRPYVKPPSRIA